MINATGHTPEQVTLGGESSACRSLEPFRNFESDISALRSLIGGEAI